MKMNVVIGRARDGDGMQCTVGRAADYPSRPIRLVMPNAPGSSADTMGRIAAIRLGEALGQQIVVDNRAGAGGVVGLEIGKNANPDGYTLITTSLGALTVSPHIRKNLPYDPMRDFEYRQTTGCPRLTLGTRWVPSSTA